MGRTRQPARRYSRARRALETSATQSSRAIALAQSRPIGKFGLVACLAFGLLAAACARPDDWIETYPDIAAQARQEPQAFLSDVYDRWGDLRGMVGSYQVRASRGVSSRTLDTQIFLLRDRFLEIQVLSPAATSEGYLVSGRNEIGFWTSEENYLYRGAIEPGEFGRALGLDLEPEDIVAVLMGFGVSWKDGTAPVASWDESRRRIRVEGETGTIAWLHPVAARFERVVVSTDSGPIEITYEEWAGSGPPIPLRMTIEVPEEDVTLRLRLAAAWHANPEGLDEEYFEVLPVGGALEAPLSQLAADGGLLRRGLGR